MIRVFKLIIIGLIVAAMIWGIVWWIGGVPRLLGVRITVDIKANSNGTATRKVQIFGPPAVVEYMPILLGLVKDKWEVIQNSNEPGKLILEMKENISGEDKSWNLSTVEIKSSKGLIHRTVSYTEMLSANTFEYSTFSKNLSENSGSILEEGRSALDETKARLIKAAITFARSVPIYVTVKMPGNIVESPAFGRKSRNVAYFEGKYNDFTNVGKLQIVSKSLTPVLGKGGLLIIIGLPVVLLGYHLYRRYTIWVALRGNENGLRI